MRNTRLNMMTPDSQHSTEGAFLTKIAGLTAIVVASIDSVVGRSKRPNGQLIFSPLFILLLALAGCGVGHQYPDHVHFQGNTQAGAPTIQRHAHDLERALWESAESFQKATGPLSREEAAYWQGVMMSHYRVSNTAKQLEAMLDANEIIRGEDRMPIKIQFRWDEGKPMPSAGYPVYISMHGGGAYPAERNDKQWAIHQKRYPALQGFYICPRAARNTWDQWHEQHTCALIDTLVRALLLRDDIDPDRIYLTGFCSGGNGVYQLGPILADRWAAVSAAKGIPEDPPIENLRNCPIDIQWAEDDPDTIDRPGMNRATVNDLYELHNADRDGYTFREMEHWKQGRAVNDQSTIKWLARHTRTPYPRRVVWVQNRNVRESSNPLRHTFYYLAICHTETWDGTGPDRITADLDPVNNTVHMNVTGYEKVMLRLNDAMLDLDSDITVKVNGQTVHDGPVERRIETMTRTMQERGDARYIFSVELVLPVPVER